MSARTLILVVFVTTTGCSYTVRKPNWAHPGPAPFQRYNATQFDPYPQNDMGPEIVGGRPAGYPEPPSEVERARQQRPFGPTGGSPPPILPGPVPLPTAPLY